MKNPHDQLFMASTDQTEWLEHPPQKTDALQVGQTRLVYQKQALFASGKNKNFNPSRVIAIIENLSCVYLIYKTAFGKTTTHCGHFMPLFMLKISFRASFDQPKCSGGAGDSRRGCEGSAQGRVREVPVPSGVGARRPPHHVRVIERDERTEHSDVFIMVVNAIVAQMACVVRRCGVISSCCSSTSANSAASGGWSMTPCRGSARRVAE